jgi:anti-sigma factor (TIGR02949 family)
MSEMDRSTCEDTVRRLNDFLDRELQESDMAIVREHLNACEVCANGFEFNGSVLHAIKAKLHDASLPDGLKGRIFARLRAMEEGNVG